MFKKGTDWYLVVGLVVVASAILTGLLTVGGKMNLSAEDHYVVFTGDVENTPPPLQGGVISLGG